MKVLLCDADDTLFDFKRGERAAISDTFRAFGIPDTPEHAALYHQVNLAQWKRLERGETTQSRLRVDRFRVFLAEAGLSGEPRPLCDFLWKGGLHAPFARRAGFLPKGKPAYAHLSCYQRHRLHSAHPVFVLRARALYRRARYQRGGGPLQARSRHGV